MRVEAVTTGKARTVLSQGSKWSGHSVLISAAGNSCPAQGAARGGMRVNPNDSRERLQVSDDLEAESPAGIRSLNQPNRRARTVRTVVWGGAAGRPLSQLGGR